MSVPVTITPSVGDGVTTVFTLGVAQTSISLYIDGIWQNPSLYTFVAGSTTVRFATAPPTFTSLGVTGDTAVAASSGTATLSGVTTGLSTLATIRLAAQQRADMVGSQFLTTAEWNYNINASYTELYDLIVQAYGNDYYSSTPYQFTTDGTTERYPLPDGSSTYQLPNSGGTAPAFYKGLGVEVQVNGSATNWVTLRPFPFIERNKWSVPGVQVAYGLRGRLRYRYNGNFLWLKPVPVANQVARIWYVPRPTQLVNDTDVVDGVSGWEEYIVVDAALKALQKEESDVSVVAAQKKDLYARIQAAAENRDVGSPMVVGDARGLFGRGYGGLTDEDDREVW